MSPLLLTGILLSSSPTAFAAGDVASVPLAQSDDQSSSSDDQSSDQDSGGQDALDEILQEGRQESVRQEQESLRQGDIDERVGVQSEQILPEQQVQRRRLIKTIERKNFLKLGRFEASPFVGFVTNDPFINRYLAGGALAYHLTEVFALEGLAGYSPDFGKADWKPLTEQLVDKNKVSPDISKLTAFGHVGFQFSPIYGKVAIRGRHIINFDVFGSFGVGATLTRDDLEALGDDSEQAQATAVQWHPTTNIGGGARVIFNQSVAFRLEGRSLVYIETIQSTTLEMKNNFILQGAVSFFFPGMD